MRPNLISSIDIFEYCLGLWEALVNLILNGQWTKDLLAIFHQDMAEEDGQTIALTKCLLIQDWVHMTDHRYFDSINKVKCNDSIIWYDWMISAILFMILFFLEQSSGDHFDGARSICNDYDQPRNVVAQNMTQKVIMNIWCFKPSQFFINVIIIEITGIAFKILTAKSRSTQHTPTY